MNIKMCFVFETRISRMIVLFHRDTFYCLQIFNTWNFGVDLRISNNFYKKDGKILRLKRRKVLRNFPANCWSWNFSAISNCTLSRTWGSCLKNKAYWMLSLLQQFNPLSENFLFPESKSEMNLDCLKHFFHEH